MTNINKISTKQCENYKVKGEDKYFNKVLQKHYYNTLVGVVFIYLFKICIFTPLQPDSNHEPMVIMRHGMR